MRSVSWARSSGDTLRSSAASPASDDAGAALDEPSLRAGDARRDDGHGSSSADDNDDDAWESAVSRRGRRRAMVARGGAAEAGS